MRQRLVVEAGDGGTGLNHQFQPGVSGAANHHPDVVHQIVGQRLVDVGGVILVELEGKALQPLEGAVLVLRHVRNVIGQAVTAGVVVDSGGLAITVDTGVNAFVAAEVFIKLEVEMEAAGHRLPVVLGGFVPVFRPLTAGIAAHAKADIGDRLQYVAVGIEQCQASLAIQLAHRPQVPAAMAVSITAIGRTVGIEDKGLPVIH